MKKLFFMVIITLGAAFLMQGFQCGATKEMNEAKKMLKQEKYEEAKDQLGMELNNNPTNEKARLMLIEINLKQNNLKEAAKLVMDATDQLKAPENLAELAKIKNQLWVNSYNGGIRHFQKYDVTQDKTQLDSAISNFETGIIVRPNLLQFYYYKGICYQMLGDTTNWNASFDEYVTKIAPELDFAQSNGFGYEMDVDKVISKLGGEVKNSIYDTTKNNTSGLRVKRVDNIILADSTDVYLYSGQVDSDSYQLFGWRLNYPADWTDREKNTWMEINLEPISRLSQYYYFNNDLRNALKYLKQLQKADPFNEIANSSIIEIYQKLDEMDVAIQELDQLTKNNPEEPLYFVLWADMLTNSGKYEEAEKKYQEALKVNPNYDFALRNLASTYKNMAAKIQAEESEKEEKDKTYKVDTEKYFPLLRRSVEYFEKARATDRFKNDPLILGEMANIYQVLGQKDKLMSTIQAMEDIENLIPDERKIKFYLDLIRVYSNIKPQTPEIQQKLNQLNAKVQ